MENEMDWDCSTCLSFSPSVCMVTSSTGITGMEFWL